MTLHMQPDFRGVQICGESALIETMKAGSRLYSNSVVSIPLKATLLLCILLERI